MIKCASGGILLLSSIFIRFSVFMVSILERASARARNRSACVGLVFVGVGKVGIVPDTRREGTRSLGPIVSFMSLLAIPNAVLLSRDEVFILITLNILLSR